MSIILKGIELPKDIGDIISINLYDKKDNWLDNIEVDRKDIIEIPTPHGRLIDGGKLYKDFENYCSGECDCCVHETENYNCGLIANAPTILESEE